ncbi:MAG TPA: alanine racemase [Solirubrobacteraceae bacterium]|nr:alanine racemase [Solirubrobacteraceae bacterium]HUB74685.1 alanine racemase [Solirubrobacteraceae bacterium]
MEPLAGSTFRDILAGAFAGPGDGPDVVIRQVSTHSRRIHSGSAFFAIGGQHADGHSFAAEALENGAAVVVARAGASSDELVRTGRIIEVDDPLQALQRLAGWWRTQIEGKVVAVVGGNGKTITKDALAHLLADELTAYASPGSYNSKLGVPLALLGCPRECDVAIFELAVSAPGEMATLERIVRPDHVMMTNLGARWRPNFRDRGDQARELLASAANLGSDGWLLLGQHDEEIGAAAGDASRCRRLVCGEAAELPSFSEPRYARDGLVVDVSFPDGRSGVVSVRTPSAEILADVELAMSAAWLLGVGSASLLTSTDDYAPSATRMEIWRSPAGVTLIRDVATPDPIAVGSGIRAAKRVAGANGRTVVVLGERLELVDPAGVGELAHALRAERVDAVYALHGPLPDALHEASEAVEEPVPVNLFTRTEDLRLTLLEDLKVGDVALVQSPRTAPIGDLTAELIGAMAPTRLYLDLSALEQNVSSFRRMVGPSVRVMGMVKALAYGTDDVNVASCLEASGVDFLGVSNADEGVALRRSGIAVPILVMLGTGRDLEVMLRHRLTPLVYSEEMLEAVLAVAPPANARLPVHVKIDTGMHRTGLAPAQARRVLTRLRDCEHIRLEGIMTHFACADDPAEDDFTAAQLRAFNAVLDVAAELGLHDLIRHAASTASTVRLPQTHLDMVRIGLGLFGLHPSEATRTRADLIPAFGLVSRIVEILELEEGARIGYGGTYRVPSGGARVGVVPAGYHDCVPRAFSNRGHVIVAGVECPILGRVSMDSMTVELTCCPDAHVGSDVLILGRHGDRDVAPERLAALIETIPYELMVRVGPRVQRILTRH